MIGVDRPGYGLTTPHPGHGFGDWAADIGALADHLGIMRFAVVGHSLCAAFALACGVHLPLRVTVILLLSAMGPWAEGAALAVRSPVDALFWRLARRQATWLLAPLCRLSTTLVLTNLRGDPQRVVARFATRLPAADRRALEPLLAEPAAPAAFIRDLREGYAQGNGALAADLLLYSRPWGFRLADVATEVHLWHGADDPKVPVALARGMAQALPRGQIQVEPGGHLVTCGHRPEILTLVRSGAAGQA
jgi:pimeloyl-ACP methyl ester carboxylesterase